MNPTLCDDTLAAADCTHSHTSKPGRGTEDQADLSWLDAGGIASALAKHQQEDAGWVREILAKAKALKGLTAEEVAALIPIRSPDLLEELYATARYAKEEIYGKRIVLFAPMYITNYCANTCTYCAFSKENTTLKRRALTADEIRREGEVLIQQGHKRLMLVAGESYPGGMQYVLDALQALYSIKIGNGEIRRINVNLAPLSVRDFRLLHEVGIGTYQMFQETYQRDVYAQVHTGGKKADFDWRLGAHDRAMMAGIDDIGLGVLYGLGDWRFDTLALLHHAEHLEKTFGAGCHTISVPRIEPAHGSDVSFKPQNPVSDEDFKKIVAILRIAVPYTGIVMSTRETAVMRRETLAVGVSQISAGSRTNPGGYAARLDQETLPGDETEEAFDESQFSLGDHRSLDEVVRDLAQMGYTPSFCTACYRNGRTGEDFMHWAKSGDIKEKCAPNSAGTFMEYLLDYATPETAAIGLATLERDMNGMTPQAQRIAKIIVSKIKDGKRDVFC